MPCQHVQSITFTSQKTKYIAGERNKNSNKQSQNYTNNANEDARQNTPTTMAHHGRARSEGIYTERTKIRDKKNEKGKKKQAESKADQQKSTQQLAWVPNAVGNVTRGRSPLYYRSVVAASGFIACVPPSTMAKEKIQGGVQQTNNIRVGNTRGGDVARAKSNSQEKRIGEKEERKARLFRTRYVVASVGSIAVVLPRRIEN